MSTPMIGTRLGVTARQKQVFEFLRRFIDQQGRSPTYDEIAAGIGLRSRGRVAVLIKSLCARGWVTYAIGCKQSLAIVDRPAAGAEPYKLPASIQLALDAYCARTGEQRDSIVADAVALFLDEAERDQAA